MWKRLETFLIKVRARKPLTGQELCRRDQHEWPLMKDGMEAKEQDSTVINDVRFDPEASDHLFRLVKEDIVRCYIQKGTQKCSRDGCTATRRVYRKISAGLRRDGGEDKGAWMPLLPDREAEISGYPKDGNQPFLRSSFFNKTKVME